MVDANRPFQKLATLATLGAVVAASGCVTRGTFRTEVESLRAEIQGVQESTSELDRRLSGRIDAMEGRMLALEGELRALEDEFGARVERMEQALRVHMPVHFGFDQATLDQDQVPILERLAGVLREYYPQALLTVEGFTDPAGSVEYNLRLGQQRADEVRAYLLGQGGFSDAQIRAVSYGKDATRLVRPNAMGPGPEGRENRRVVVVIDHPDAWGPAVTMTDATSG